jgi:hypothetical protein
VVIVVVVVVEIEVVVLLLLLEDVAPEQVKGRGPGMVYDFTAGL